MTTPVTDFYLTTESLKVLYECMLVQKSKGDDYQNSLSTVRQADYYVRGLWSLYDIMHAKMLRLKSLMDAMEANPSKTPNYESLEDSAKDLANYCSFFVAWCRGKIDGQDLENRDLFNRKNRV